MMRAKLPQFSVDCACPKCGMTPNRGWTWVVQHRAEMFYKTSTWLFDVMEITCPVCHYKRITLPKDAGQ